MAIQQPAQAFECLAIIRVCFSPLLFADLIDCVVQGFDDVEAIQDQRGIGAMVLDGAYVGFAHVATGPLDLGSPVLTKRLGEEPVDGFSPFSRADPHHASAFQVIDKRGVFVALGVRDLVDTDGFQPSNAVAIPQPCHGSVQQIG